jgi:hypothetical protein
LNTTGDVEDGRRALTLAVLRRRRCAKIQFLEKLTYKGAPGENSNNTRAFEVFNKATRQPKKPTPEPGKPKIEVIGELKPKVRLRA